MRITKSTLTALILIVIFSIFIANVSNLLSTQSVYDKGYTVKGRTRFKIGDGAEHLVWFLQITDIHISIFQDPTRITQFREFCDYAVNVIKPKVVLASGDLTDAKTYDSIGSKQFEEEWKHYRETLEQCKALEKTVWLDIRGNHDNFNVAGYDSKQNFFTNYSIQGKKHPRSYMYQLRHTGELYSFIGVDACLEPGPKRPFNFIGMLDDLEVDEINKLIEKTVVTGSNYSIWFGHFPTSCIISPHHGPVRSLIGRDGNSVVYVCGHLHRLGGLVPKMYTLQQQGFLELELGDWKDNRVYRLMVIDHGMFSFRDIEHGQWPVILITNPKNTLFLVHKLETVQTIKESTHIRILAFSVSDIVSVEVRVDGDGVWKHCRRVSGGPLFVVEWEPRDYAYGLHHVQVRAIDYDGREQIVSQPFSLDESRLSFEFFPRFVLMSDASTIFKCMFAFMIVVTVLPLISLRYIHKRTKAKKLTGTVPPRKKHCCYKLIRKLWMLSAVDVTFWPLVLYPVYLTFGPWSIGYLVEDHVGVVFAWGIFVNDTFLPGSFTYAYGFLQLLGFHVPLILILAHGVDISFQRHQRTLPKTKRLSIILSLHLPFSIIIALQILMACLFLMAYGVLAFLLGFLRTWSVILAIVLWHFVLHLPQKYLQEIALIWGSQLNARESKPNLAAVDD